jgi:hypothetical protein
MSFALRWDPITVTHVERRLVWLVGCHWSEKYIFAIAIEDASASHPGNELRRFWNILGRGYLERLATGGFWLEGCSQADQVLLAMGIKECRIG